MGSVVQAVCPLLSRCPHPAEGGPGVFVPSHFAPALLCDSGQGTHPFWAPFLSFIHLGRLFQVSLSIKIAPRI